MINVVVFEVVEVMTMVMMFVSRVPVAQYHEKVIDHYENPRCLYRGLVWLQLLGASTRIPETPCVQERGQDGPEVPAGGHRPGGRPRLWRRHEAPDRGGGGGGACGGACSGASGACGGGGGDGDHHGEHGLVQVDDDGKIVDAKFKTFGCGSAIASSR